MGEAIRFRHPDYDPDRAQKLISSSMFRHVDTQHFIQIHARVLSNIAHRQTDRQTDKLTRGAGENIIYLLRCWR